MARLPATTRTYGMLLVNRRRVGISSKPSRSIGIAARMARADGGGISL
jgi:hypothetical protein